MAGLSVRKPMAFTLISTDETADDTSVLGNTSVPMLTYELPLCERIRTFLRLESLFGEGTQAIYGESLREARQSLMALVTILHILDRNDLRTDVIKELDHQISRLAELDKIQDVDPHKLTYILDEMESLLDELIQHKGRLGQSLRDQEVLSSILQRMGLIAGTCDFDLPILQHWLGQEMSTRSEDLQEWYQQLDGIRRSINLILKLTRESNDAQEAIAVAGFYQNNLNKQRAYQLLQVSVARHLQVFPEISAGKHRV
ncbi:MAG TPA: cell division protein ZapD, partial [Gammaproteobacteria bacterium]|nr:cell division protein ZapD [Gammaproteobacteria bacterium]